MELRVLQYFLAVAREQSITAAAESLHLSQPTLSTQLKDLEKEMGKQLLIRNKKGLRKIELTEDGMILRKRAEEILALVQKTENELSSSGETVAGDILIGAAETDKVEFIARIGRELQQQYPGIHYDIFSSNRGTVMERLEKGIIDFGIVYGTVDETKYHSLRLPQKDSWIVLMREDSPLAQKETITPQDLWDKPLVMSRQKEPLLKWLGKSEAELNITSTCNLIYNSAILVREGFGYCLTLIRPTNADELCVRPICPSIEAELYIAWKKYQVFSKASEKFLALLQERCV